jgi:hypothetical protein
VNYRTKRVVVLLTSVIVSCVSEPVVDAPREPAGDIQPAREVRCDQQISGGVIREYPDWKDASVRVGSVFLWPAAEFSAISPKALRPASTTGRGPRFFPDQLKVQLIVGEGVEAEVRLAEPNVARFFFRAPTPRNGYYLSEGHSALLIEGCAGQAYTEYSSGLVVAGARCLRVEVSIAGDGREASRGIPVGVPGC